MISFRRAPECAVVGRHRVQERVSSRSRWRHPRPNRTSAGSHAGSWNTQPRNNPTRTGSFGFGDVRAPSGFAARHPAGIQLLALVGASRRRTPSSPRRSDRLSGTRAFRLPESQHGWIEVAQRGSPIRPSSSPSFLSQAATAARASAGSFAPGRIGAPSVSCVASHARGTQKSVDAIVARIPGDDAVVVGRIALGFAERLLSAVEQPLK